MNKSSPRVVFGTFCNPAPAYLFAFTSGYLPASTFQPSPMEELKYSVLPLPRICFLPLNSTYFNPVQMSFLEKGFPRALASFSTPPHLFPRLLIATQAISTTYLFCTLTKLFINL
jgi:hypothetical protein